VNDQARGVKIGDKLITVSDAIMNSEVGCTGMVGIIGYGEELLRGPKLVKMR
jgi:hypothetical protein